MTVNGVGFRSSPVLQALADMRVQLGDLQRQLGTGKKSTDYAGLGLNRGLSVGLQAKLTALTSYGDTIDSVDVRLSLAQTALTRIAGLQHTVKSATQLDAFDLDAGGQTTAQHTAQMQLDEILTLLNARAGDRYLFSGRAVDQPAVETTDHILNGDGTRAGFKQILSERSQADLGSGLGRLSVPPAAGSTVSMAEDVAGSPFGFKLAGVASTLSGATVAGPSGSPPAVSVNFAANPASGQTVTFTFDLPDGTTENLTLTATTSANPAANQFTLGGSTTATAANLQAALAASVGKLAATSLAAASAVAAANDFFNVGAGVPPMRVAGPPFSTATALTAGTSVNTVTWYTGEMGTDAARGTAVTRIDEFQTVAYGVRANEQGIRAAVANIAVFAAMSYSPSDTDAGARFAALNGRLGAALDVPPGLQKVEDITAELAGAQTALSVAKDRHRQTASTLQNLLQGIEGVPQEEVAAQILALQTNLQASLQTTAMLYRISIINYL
jgi:flagellar hook-associated protein 3 FlgL